MFEKILMGVIEDVYGNWYISRIHFLFPEQIVLFPEQWFIPKHSTQGV